MEHYTTQPEQHNNIGAEDCESVTDRYAQRISHRTGFPISHIRAALRANAAVKEH